MTKRKVTNIDGIERIFETDESFLEFVRQIYKENEEGQPYDSDLHWLPENIQQATEYLVEYCDNLELIEY